MNYNIYINHVQSLFKDNIITAEEYAVIMNRIVELVVSEKSGDNSG